MNICINIYIYIYVYLHIFFMSIDIIFDLFE